MTSELFWIPGPWNGKLAISARPRGEDWLDDEMLALRGAGIDILVSLLEPAEAEQLGLGHEAEAAASRGIHFLSLPTPDRGLPNSAQATVFLEDIIRMLEAGKNIAVHCRQSVGRSGLIGAGALVSAGMRPEEAIAVVSAARKQPVPETAAQRQWIMQLQPRHAEPHLTSR